jgi:small conductance mechanosensitive channel
MESTVSHLFQTLDAAALIELALIVVGALVLITLEQRLLPWAADKLHGYYRHMVLATVPLLRLVIIGIALLLALPIVIEPSWQNMAALLGTAGLALGFALKDYVSSLIAGVVSAFERPYRPGDWIEIDGIYGEVVHVGMRSVALLTPDDDYVTIPHLKLWHTAVKNGIIAPYEKATRCRGPERRGGFRRHRHLAEAAGPRGGRHLHEELGR